MDDLEGEIEDVAHDLAAEHEELEEREYRYANPHCKCQTELVWNDTIRSWVCNTPDCQYNQHLPINDNSLDEVLLCDTCHSEFDVLVMNSGQSSWDHVRKQICYSCLVDQYGYLVNVEASRVQYRSRDSRGLPPLDDK